MHKALVALAASAVTVFSLGAAPTASAAATHRVTLTCQGPSTIYGEVGDTFIFTLADTCSIYWELENALQYINPVSGFLFLQSTPTNVGPRVGGGIGAQVWGYYSNGLGTTTFTTTLLAADGNGNPLTLGGIVAIHDDDLATGFFNIVYGGVSAPGQAPPPVLQAVGLPNSGSCLDIKDTHLNWGGASSGSWTKSWHQWMNGGAGGAVCQRTLYYAADGSWAAR
jgi:hypothetical protein